MSKKYHSFNIIRSRGTPNKVTLYDGTIVHRNKENKVWLTGAEIKQLMPGIAVKNTEMVGIPMQDYDDHFLFETPSHIPGPSYMCSCGSGANFYGSLAYESGASPVGLKLLCAVHVETGKHAELK